MENVRLAQCRGCASGIKQHRGVCTEAVVAIVRSSCHRIVVFGRNPDHLDRSLGPLWREARDPLLDQPDLDEWLDKVENYREEDVYQDGMRARLPRRMGRMRAWR